jgi:hypothetical protein
LQTEHTRLSSGKAAQQAYDDFVQRMQNKYMAGGQWAQKLSAAEETVRQQLSRAVRDARESDSTSKFQSSHWDNPNVLAHVRFDDRTALDGKKTLFLEEVQSDWAQKGKQEGYNDPTKRSALEQQISDLEKRRQEMENIGAAATEKEKQEWADIKNTLVGLKRTFNASHRGVPDMPFKQTWHELVLKRMLRHAAENGYDRMAWVTGDQTADRYDLSKQVDEVRATKAKDNGKFSITALKDGSPVVKEIDLEESKLADYVGKDLAQKITAQSAGKQASYSGIDLKMGGEWARNLYDKAIPNFLNKYAKKWDAKVSTTDLSSGKTFSVEYNPNYEQEKWAVYEHNKGESHLRGTWKSEDAAQRFMKDLQNADKTTVHSIEITPVMKKSVLKEGQPIAKNEPTWADGLAESLRAA